MKRFRLEPKHEVIVRVGDRGQVTTGLHPHGFVLVNGQRYEAHVDFGAAEPGDEVVVLSGDNLGLMVRKLAPGEKCKLKNAGERVLALFLDKVVVEGTADQAKREAVDLWRRTLAVKAGAAAGFLCAALALGLVWDFVLETCPPPWHYVTPVLALFGGSGFGAALAVVMHAFLRDIDPDFTRLTLPSVGFGLAGATTGAVLGIQFAGLAAGVAAAIAGTILLGLLVPGFFMLIQWGGEA